VDVTVRPIGIASLTAAPTSIVGAQPVAGTVSLECIAGPGPIVVDLGSSNPLVAGPVSATIVVPQGSRSAAFSVSTNRVLAKSSAVISAKANGIQKSKTLTVTPAAVVSPTSLKFGSVPLNTSRTLTTRLSNQGTVPFAVQSITLGGPSPQYYRVAHNCPTALNAAASCDVTVTFTPTVTAYRSAYLYITTDATAVPLKVLLTGTGVTQ